MLWKTYFGDVCIGMQAAHLSGQRPAQAAADCANESEDVGPRRLRTEVGGAASGS